MCRLPQIDELHNSMEQRILPEKLTVSQLLKKLPAFYGTRRFITAFTRAATCPCQVVPKDQSGSEAFVYDS